MSRPPTYENIVSVLSGFVEDCHIMPRGYAKRHSPEKMVGIMADAAACTASAGGYAAAVRARSGENPDAPGDEWVRKAFLRADTAVVGAAMEGAISQQLTELKECGAIGDTVTVAIDKHLIARYDKRPGPGLLRSKRKKGTMHFEAYITAQCVDDGSRLTLAALPIGTGDPTAEFVRKIVRECDRQGVRVRCFLMDREFFSVSVLEAMDEKKQKYLVPCRNTYNVVEALNEFDRGVREGTSEATLENAGSSVKYVMITVNRTARRNRDPDAKPEEKFIGFAANSNEFDVAAYRKRWGIETGYRMIEDVRLRTRSTNPGARLLCFAASVILYNQWVVLNALQWNAGECYKWCGIVFTVLQFKAVMVSGYGIMPEPEPPPVTVP